MSGDASGLDVDMERVVDTTYVGDVGIDDSAELLAFTNAVEQGGDAEAARQTLISVVGAEGLVEAAATIAAFNGLVRVADGTGIQLDDGLAGFSHADRARLGIDAFAGAANTRPAAPVGAPATSISELFG